MMNWGLLAEQGRKEWGNSQMLGLKQNLVFILSKVGHLHRRVCNAREYPSGPSVQKRVENGYLAELSMMEFHA